MDSVIPALVVVRKYSFCCFCFCWISSIFKEISSGKILQHSENNRNLLIYLKVKYFKFGDWKKWKTHAILAAFARACVCVCVWVGGWVGGCACVFILFHREGFFPLQDVCDILEGYGSTMLFVSIMSYFTSEDETPACRLTGEKIWYDIIRASAKMIYYDIGYKSATL